MKKSLAIERKNKPNFQKSGVENKPIWWCRFSNANGIYIPKKKYKK